MGSITTIKTILDKNSIAYKRFKTPGVLIFDIQGHRGCRGLMPENTIQGFMEALKIGANTLEMDVVISGDGQVVVSHEPWMSPEICLSPDGSIMGKNEMPNLFQMKYEEICQYDCGRKVSHHFPVRKSMNAVKPLLSEVINRVEKYILWNSFRPVQYNIEIKSSPEWDNVFQPKPEETVLKVYDLIRSKNIQRRCTIQSVDLRPLQIFRRIAPQMRLSLLVENDCSVTDNLDALGFKPDVYSPDFRLVDTAMIQAVHHAEMKIIPWTVNEILDMNELIQMGVDGLITDYPDVAVKLME